MSEIPTMSDLYNLAYVPGQFKCMKCGFVLNKLTITLNGIGTSESNRQSEPCPNDGEFLVAVSYKEVANELTDRAFKLFDQVAKQSALIDELANALKELIDYSSAVANCKMCTPWSLDDTEAGKKAIAALAKARGEQS